MSRTVMAMWSSFAPASGAGVCAGGRPEGEVSDTSATVVTKKAVDRLMMRTSRRDAGCWGLPRESSDLGADLVQHLASSHVQRFHVRTAEGIIGDEVFG